MKRLSLVFAVALGLAACGDNSANGTGGSIDSASTAPSMDENSTYPADSATLDTSSGINQGGTGTGGTIDGGTIDGSSGTDQGSGHSGGAGTGNGAPSTDNQESR